MGDFFNGQVSVNNDTYSFYVLLFNDTLNTLLTVTLHWLPDGVQYQINCASDSHSNHWTTRNTNQ